MTNKALSIFNQLRPVTVGFDNVFDHFERKRRKKKEGIANFKKNQKKLKQQRGF